MSYLILKKKQHQFTWQFTLFLPCPPKNSWKLLSTILLLAATKSNSNFSFKSDPGLNGAFTERTSTRILKYTYFPHVLIIFEAITFNIIGNKYRNTRTLTHTVAAETSAPVHQLLISDTHFQSCLRT